MLACFIAGNAAVGVQVCASIPVADLESMRAYVRQLGGHDSAQLRQGRAFTLAAVSSAIASGARMLSRARRIEVAYKLQVLRACSSS